MVVRTTTSRSSKSKKTNNKNIMDKRFKDLKFFSMFALKEVLVRLNDGAMLQGRKCVKRNNGLLLPSSLLHLLMLGSQALAGGKNPPTVTLSNFSPQAIPLP